MEISQIAGLPAHALVVHVAVVLVPLSGLAFVATCWRPDWRRKYGLLIAALAVVGAAGAVLAASTGEPLADSVRQAARASGDVARLGEHPEQGDTARLVAVVFAMVAAGFYAIVRWGDRYRVPPWAVHATYGGRGRVGNGKYRGRGPFGRGPCVARRWHLRDNTLGPGVTGRGSKDANSGLRAERVIE